MKRNENTELIQRILEGDDAAFACLVKKYQKRVHALAWRKIGDFHIAEDITQETFFFKDRSTPYFPPKFTFFSELCTYSALIRDII